MASVAAGDVVMVVCAVIGALAVLVPVAWRVVRWMGELAELTCTVRKLVCRIDSVTQRLEDVERRLRAGRAHRG